MFKTRWLRRTALCLAVMLVAAMMTCSAALAASPMYTSTSNTMAYFDQQGLRYTYTEPESGSDSERVKVGMNMDNFNSLDCVLIFKEDSVSLRIWYIVTATAGKSYITQTLNGLNAKYKYAKFVFDESDSTVQVEADMPVNKNTCGPQVYEMMIHLFNIIDDSECAEALHSLE